MQLFVLFCIMRKASDKNDDVKNQVNIPLYDIQELMCGKDNVHKAFVYQEDEVIVCDFDRFSADDIKYMPARTENASYSDCINISLSLLDQEISLHMGERSRYYLVLLFEQMINANELRCVCGTFLSDENKSKTNVVAIVPENVKSKDDFETLKREIAPSEFNLYTFADYSALIKKIRGEINAN